MRAVRGSLPGTIEIKAWIFRGAQAAGFTAVRMIPIAITIDWYDNDGALLFSLDENDALVGQDPDAQNVYGFTATETVQDNKSYYAIVSITDGAGQVSNPIPVTFETGSAARVSVISDGLSPDNLEIVAWLERGGAPVRAGLVSATIRFMEPNGTVVFGPDAMTLNASEGLFRLSKAATALGDATNYVADVVITDAEGVSRAYQSQPTLA